ncbi:uncharacterized protein [Spinacia oleracea]|uniref:Uncharacterized protein n=1 Tax=Spinacia oleracea TaxID=3562 RepID=A0ABM3R755_SPIOL|nr:uncharacterized protein LOC110779119 [Spinacia oleracea]
MPYDHRNTTPDGASSAKMKALVNDLNYRHFQGHCMTGSGGGSVGYLAHGTATDYIYEIAKVPMAFTFEIYGDESASECLTQQIKPPLRYVISIAFKRPNRSAHFGSP